MTDNSELRVRPSVRDLQRAYDHGDKEPLENLVRAWIGIESLPPDDPNSFFMLGGYHGEPFDYRPPGTDYLYWGGYCNHGNVLFPTWHRVYVLKLEDALRTIVPSVTLPFWDETSEESLAKGIPKVLTQETFELDGKPVKNPLRSFVLPEALSDLMNEPSSGDTDHIYAKPKDYETVRYPLSGLVGTPAAKAITDKHNAQYTDPDENTVRLNDNVMAWLKGENPTPAQPNPPANGIHAMFERCLEAPSYTLFSNTTSAQAWAKNHPGIVTPLEEPHNDVHLSVGGFDVPNSPESGQVAGANGDMGENNTAALDPIFFFHHCNVDRMFWLWQKQTGLPVEIDYEDPGANSNASQGPTPGYPPNMPLTMQTPLFPFTKADSEPYLSTDCVDAEAQLGYTYGPGSLEEGPTVTTPDSKFSTKKLTVSSVDRSLFEGSFVLTAYATVTDASGNEQKYYLGHHSVLSRRNVVSCVNCQTHLEVIAHFPLSTMPADEVENAKFSVQIQHRGKALPEALDMKLEVKD